MATNAWVLLDLLVAVIESKIIARPELKAELDEYRSKNPDASFSEVSKVLSEISKRKLAEVKEKLEG